MAEAFESSARRAEEGFTVLRIAYDGGVCAVGFFTAPNTHSPIFSKELYTHSPEILYASLYEVRGLSTLKP